MKKAISLKTTRRSTGEPERADSVSPTSIHKIEADGVQVFYREAGEPNAPVVLLLHGFPASSFMFRELIPRLAGDYRVIAPDLPGFGFTEVPAERKYAYIVRSIGADDRGVHASAQNQPLCDLRVRLWRANRLPLGDGSPRARSQRSFHKTETPTKKA